MNKIETFPDTLFLVSSNESQEPLEPKETKETKETQKIKESTIENSYKNHLEFAGQTYRQHFKDSMKYSWKSFKASVVFFIHAVYPNSLRHTGSSIITEVNDTIVTKYSERIATISNQVA